MPTLPRAQRAPDRPPGAPAGAPPGSPTGVVPFGPPINARRAGAPRGRTPPGQGGRLRGEIVAAAERLLAASGDEDALSLRAVAREAGIAAPSVYLHFASKEDLLRGVVAEFFLALRDAVRAASAGIAEPRQALLAGCLAYCRFAAERPGAYRALFATPRPEAGPPDVPGDPGSEAFATLTDGIAACMGAGFAPPADPHRVAVDVWSALHGIASLRRALPNFPWPPLEPQLRGVLAGLAGVRFGGDPADPGAGAERP